MCRGDGTDERSDGSCRYGPFDTFLAVCWDRWEDEVKWNTKFVHLNRGDTLTSEQHRCTNEKKKF
ncbi:hypothetical protein LC20_07620 [Yersinia hibernica]|uniref:Uncharacterized protein n=1 Tax=Yersinia enterocolitica LC20 TaxID=1443113 RepID=A0A7U5SSM4_YEREN|nr:hypothetical protein LC20_07620 [Yersinia hibernica]OVZ89346.1 hypothetical protein CBW54_08235 [Yersinia kristensenii]